MLNIPGVTGLPGADVNPELWDKAEKEAERLGERLKQDVRVEQTELDALRRELRITVPASVIAEHMELQYAELRNEAIVPGFRKGRAPRQLIVKRFGPEVRESLTTTIIGRAFMAVTENEKLDVLGDPAFRVEADGGVKLVDFDQALVHLKLPDNSDFAFTCEVELKPQFELPALEGIPVKAVDVPITDEMVDDEITRRRKLRGSYEPVEAAADKDDQVIADVVLMCEGVEVKREENLALGMRPTRLDGVTLPEFGSVVGGAASGDVRRAECVLPNDYERADLRGKPAVFEFRVHEVKRLAPQPLDEFLSTWGYDSEADLREDVRHDIEHERDSLLERAKKAQIEQYLLANTRIDLPTQFSARQTDRAVVRKIIELQQGGVPMDEIEVQIDALRTQARDEVADELRLMFILDRIASQFGIEVTDEQVNAEIARIASRYRQRFDRIRDDLQNRGLMNQLVDQIKQEQCLQRLLADAKFEAAAAEST